MYACTYFSFVVLANTNTKTQITKSRYEGSKEGPLMHSMSFWKKVIEMLLMRLKVSLFYLRTK